MYQVLVKEHGEFKTLFPCVWSSLGVALDLATGMKAYRSQVIEIYKYTGSGTFTPSLVAVIR